jgi:hypothetical protein
MSTVNASSVLGIGRSAADGGHASAVVFSTPSPESSTMESFVIEKWPIIRVGTLSVPQQGPSRGETSRLCVTSAAGVIQPHFVPIFQGLFDFLRRSPRVKSRRTMVVETLSQLESA